jgi:hypothetical protein
MRKVFILKYLVMLAVVSLIAACSQIPLQSKRDSFETQSVPDSSKDYSDEMSFIEDWEYETSVRYNDLEFKKAFDAAQLSVKKAGYRVVFADKDSGRIDGERVLGTDPKDIYPLQVMIEKREMSLVVYLRAKAVRGTIDSSNLCTFYAEFDGLITAAPALRKPEPAPVMPKNVQQAEITPTPPPCQCLQTECRVTFTTTSAIFTTTSTDRSTVDTSDMVHCKPARRTREEL